MKVDLLRRPARQNVSCRCSSAAASVTETVAAHEHGEVVSMRIVPRSGRTSTNRT